MNLLGYFLKEKVKKSTEHLKLKKTTSKPPILCLFGKPHL